MPSSPSDLPLLTAARRIIVASNRGPAQFFARANGVFAARKTSGGLATALVSLAGRLPLSWIAVAGDERDRQAFADRSRRVIHFGDQRIETRYVSVPDRVYDLHYNVISNRILWFLQHYMLHPDIVPPFDDRDYRAWDEGYVVVNQLVADAVCEEWLSLPDEERSHTLVLLQDYHLYLASALIRARLPEVTMGQFVHIPWPAIRYWRFLPDHFTTEILQSIVQNDLLGLQTDMDVANFASCIATFYPDAPLIDAHDHWDAELHRHRLRIAAYPIGVDANHLIEMAHSKSGERAFTALESTFADRKVILRVDRLEPTKNIVVGLQAFARLLAEHPEMIGKVRFVMLLVPSREGLVRYRKYARQVSRLAESINATFGTSGDTPVALVLGNNHARALTAMRYCNVFLVNSVIDGMHLGAKEMALLNERQGVLIISRTTGAFQELSDACLPITPTDLRETADAMYRALTMSLAQRRALAARARKSVLAHSVIHWLLEQLRDLEAILPAPQDAPSVALVSAAHSLHS
jgi:trehalose 6-phosphate synthase